MDFIHDMIARSLFTESKKLRVFDFDDTLVKTTSFIYVTNKGKTRKLTPGQYAVYKEKPGDEFDFKDFERNNAFLDQMQQFIDCLNDSKLNAPVTLDEALISIELAEKIKFNNDPLIF